MLVPLAVLASLAIAVSLFSVEMSVFASPLETNRTVDISSVVYAGSDTYMRKNFKSSPLSRCRYAIGRWAKSDALAPLSTSRFYSGCKAYVRSQCTVKSAKSEYRCDQFENKFKNACTMMVNDYEKQASYVWLPRSVEEDPTGLCAKQYLFEPERLSSLLSPGSGLAIIGDSQGEVMYSSLACMLGGQVKNLTVSKDKRWWEPRLLHTQRDAVVEFAMSKIGIDTTHHNIIRPNETISTREFRLFNLKWTEKVMLPVEKITQRRKACTRPKE
jgi:hypothetical protein